jgi:hypothetical protein
MYWGAFTRMRKAETTPIEPDAGNAVVGKYKCIFNA